MKKLLVFFLIYISCSNIFANDSNKNEFIFSYDFLIAGFSGSRISNGKNNFDLNLNIVNLYLENNTTCLGIRFIPANYSYYFYDNEHIFNISIITFYWNLFEFIIRMDSSGSGYDRHIFGPFFSINPLSINSAGNLINGISYSAGLKFTLMHNGMSSRKVHIFPNVEIGYINNNGNHGMFFMVNIAALPVILFPLGILLYSIGMF